MANTRKPSANGTSKANHSTDEMREWFEKNRKSVENYAKSKQSIVTLRDITQGISTRTINTIDKEELKTLIKTIGSSEKKLRQTSRYLFYRSNVYFRIVMWYATMFALNCRLVTPQYSLSSKNNANTMLKSYESTLDYLEILDNQGSMVEALINVFIQDVYYAIRYSDENGTFYYPIDPDWCVIDSRYDKDFGFAIDMSKYSSQKQQKIVEYIGYPLDEMYKEYQETGNKYVHCPDDVAFCLKFRTDTWDVVAPPMLATFLQLAGLEDLVDIQAEADALSVYKMIYMPLTVHSNSNDVDDFEISPDLAHEYFNRMLSNGAIPDNVGAAIVPGEELKTIDFSKTVDSDTNSVEQASNQILQTAGGGAVINANNITSTAAFNAWLKSETEFATSTLLPQIDGYTNRILAYELGSNACKVKHLPVSVYTQKDLADQFLTANQYSYSYRLAYGTLLSVPEKDTLAMLYFENDVLQLHKTMCHPLASSYTSTGEDADYTPEPSGAPTKDDGDLTPSGDASRNQ